MTRSRCNTSRFTIRVLISLTARMVSVSVRRVHVHVRILIPSVFRRNRPTLYHPLIPGRVFRRTMLLCDRISRCLTASHPITKQVRYRISAARGQCNEFHPHAPWGNFSANFRFLRAREFRRVIINANVRSIRSVIHHPWNNRRSGK